MTFLMCCRVCRYIARGARGLLALSRYKQLPRYWIFLFVMNCKSITKAFCRTRMTKVAVRKKVCHTLAVYLDHCTRMHTLTPLKPSVFSNRISFRVLSFKFIKIVEIYNILQFPINVDVLSLSLFSLADFAA